MKPGTRARDEIATPRSGALAVPETFNPSVQVHDRFFSYWPRLAARLVPITLRIRKKRWREQGLLSGRSKT